MSKYTEHVTLVFECVNVESAQQVISDLVNRYRIIGETKGARVAGVQNGDAIGLSKEKVVT